MNDYDYVRRVVKEGESPILANRVHASSGDVTLCGKSLNERWYSVRANNDDVNCPTCRRKLLYGPSR